MLSNENTEVFDAYWADPHFGHKRIIELCKRPFASVEKMDECLIENYNSFITPYMTVAWLGDCFFSKTEDAKNIMQQLNGHKVLIWGGHDGTFSKMLHLGFSAVVYQMDIMLRKYVCTLSHFPYAATPIHDTGEIDARYEDLRPKRKKGQLLIHGHTHNSKVVNGPMINVGVDSWGYRPMMCYELRSLIDRNYPQREEHQ
jgi:calcineurin-like phosphoesterase family protein